MPRKEYNKKKKRWSEKYRVESLNFESFTEFKKRCKRMRKDNLI